MADVLELYLPILIDFLLIILLIVGIIFIIRLIGTMDKIDRVLNDVQRKVDSLNGLFNVIDFTTDKISAFSDKLVGVISSFIGRLTKKRMYEESEEEDYE